MKTATPAKTADLLSRHKINIRKKYGQNFLVDANISDKIVAAAGLCDSDTVLEIGPGLGAMTELLSRAAGHVLAVEIDSALIPVLTQNLSGCDNVELINADVLKYDLAEAARARGIERFKVVANLPYYITTPILMELLEGDAPIDSITVMVQKEVAQRMVSGPGSKDYGALSLAVQYAARTDIVCSVPPECFIPRPAVDSAVVHMALYDTPPVSVPDVARFRRIIRAAFMQRRKTLANALSADPALGLSRDQVTTALSALSIDERIRGEALTLSDFAALASCLNDPA